MVFLILGLAARVFWFAVANRHIDMSALVDDVDETAPAAAAQPANGQPPNGPLAIVDRLANALPAAPKPKLPAPDPKGEFVRPVRPSAKVGPPTPPIWDLPVDSPGEQKKPIAATLDLPLQTEKNLDHSIPLLASMRGPYILIGAVESANGDDGRGAKQHAAVKKPAPTKKLRSKSKPPGQSPPVTAAPVTHSGPTFLAQVVDLHSGKTIGQFPGLAWRYGGNRCRLSPDGEYLVGIDTVMDSRTFKEGLLMIWKRGFEEPIGSIPMRGDAEWCDFVGLKQLAMVSFQPGSTDGVLHLWDVAKQTELKKIPLKESAFPLATNGRRGYPAFEYEPTRVQGDVSPNGRYIALGAEKGLIVVSVKEGKVLGTIPSPVRFIAHKSLRFSPDGAELWSLGVTMEPGKEFEYALSVWDFAKGRLLHRSALVDQINTYLGHEGDLFLGPEPGTILFRSGALNGRWETDASGARTLPVLKFAGVYSTSGGENLFTFPVTPMRSISPTDLLAVVRKGPTEANLRVVSLDLAAFHEKALPLLAATQLRPPALAAKAPDKGPTKVTPPAKWITPPFLDKLPAAEFAKVDLKTIPQASGSSQAAVLKHVFQKQPRGRNEYQWERVDLKTGKAVGNSIRLWPWIASPDKSQNDANTQGYYVTLQHEAADPNRRWFQAGDIADIDPDRPLALAALSLDGNLLAACDPANRARVDVWDSSGKRLMGLLTEGDTAIDWLGWSKSGKLLTLVAGTLTGWDPHASKSLFAVADDFRGPVAFGGERQWLALAHGDLVDVIDSETGNCLARCSPSQAGGTIEALAVSPDGKALATARQALDDMAAKSLRYLIDVWDLAEGKSFTVVAGSRRLEFLHWSTPDHLLVVSCRRDSIPFIELIDRRAKCALGVCTLNKDYGMNMVLPGDGLPRIAATSDGRVWISLPVTRGPQAQRFWRSIAVLQPGEPLLFDPNRARFDPNQTTVRVEIDLAKPTRSQTTAEKAAKLLAAKGYQIGPNGFALCCRHTFSDSPQRLSPYEGSSEQIVIPQMEARWELLDEKGAIVWQQTDRYEFKHARSRYFTKSNTAPNHTVRGGPIVFIQYFDFQGQDARRAIQEEMLDDAAAIGVPQSFPSGSFLFAAGKYAPLPLSLDVPVPMDAPSF